jgi:LmbE family N-acetylglucosaminyl deacetylase
MNILAIGSHPDDIEYGCGGTLTKYAQKGHRIYLMIMTDGELRGDPERRRKEQMESARLMSAKDVLFGGYPDAGLVCDRNLVRKIEEAVALTTPDFVYVHSPDDTHHDHRALSQAAIPACRAVRNVLYYEGPSTLNFSPCVYVDIGPVLHAKLSCLEAHASQVMQTTVQDMSIVDLARSAAHFRGIQGRIRYAEAFAPVRLFINIE